MEAATRQLMQWPTVQVMLRATTRTGNLFRLAEHLRAHFLPAAPGTANKNQQVIGAGVAPEGTAQATEQAGFGQPQLVQSLVRLPAIQWYVLTEIGVKLKQLYGQQTGDQPRGEGNGH